MAELHLLLVIDSETKKVRIADLDEAPVDSREGVYDVILINKGGDGWRGATDREVSTIIDVEFEVINALKERGLYLS